MLPRDGDVSYSLQGKSAVVRLVHTHGLSLDDLLTVLGGRRAVAAKLQPKYIW